MKDFVNNGIMLTDFQRSDNKKYLGRRGPVIPKRSLNGSFLGNHVALIIQRLDAAYAGGRQ
ncbi:MAG: hypothetical protein V3T41_03180, partial [bacterium]